MIDLIEDEMQYQRLQKAVRGLKRSQTTSEKLETLRQLSLSNSMDVRKQAAIYWAYNSLKGSTDISPVAPHPPTLSAARKWATELVIREALKHKKGSVTDAAISLDVTSACLYNQMRKLGISLDQYKREVR